MARTKRTLSGKSQGDCNASPDKRRTSSRLRATTSSAPDNVQDNLERRNSSNHMDEDTDVEEPVFEVERIVGKMYDENGRASYLLKWKGYDETTWEPSENCDCPNLIDGYEQVIKRANRSR